MVWGATKLFNFRLQIIYDNSYHYVSGFGVEPDLIQPASPAHARGEPASKYRLLRFTDAVGNFLAGFIHRPGCGRLDCTPLVPARRSGHGRRARAMNAAAAFPLSMANEGARVRVVALRGRGLSQRLTEMGLNVGSELTVRQRQGGGLVVSRGETRYALGAGMAHGIWVERL